ncbi:MAG TPA: PAS domain-containing protein [Actinomycetota bacterium]|nr:PAS domain-containing protein [Actinomycetota bacterium]
MEFRRSTSESGGVAAGGGDPPGDLRYQELRETEVRYRALIERVPGIIYTEVADHERPSGSRATYVSPQSIRLLGYTPREIVSDPDLWDLIVHPEDRERVFEAFRTSERTGEPFWQEYRIVARDGATRWVHDEATIVEDPVSGARSWQGLMLDITAQRRAVEQHAEVDAKYRALVEQLPAIVYLGEYGEDGDWLYISPRLEHVLGYTPEEWLAHPHPMQSFTHPDDIAAVRAEEARSQREGDTFRAEYRMRARDGRWVWILDEATAVRDESGTPLFLQGVMFDVTERKLAEVELATANERLRTLDRLKNTLLHTLSHDLRGSISAILGAATTLGSLGPQLSEEERRSLLHTIEARASGMQALVSDLLDLDRLDRGIAGPKRAPVDVAELARSLVACADGLRGRRVEVFADTAVVSADRAMLERVIENLLVNAATHTPATSRVWVRVRRTRKGVLLSVDDDGPGVPDELKSAVFEAFHRGPGTADRPGSGLGLSLVRRFAELHGGRAWVEDRPGGGASFQVLVPDPGPGPGLT